MRPRVLIYPPESRVPQLGKLESTIFDDQSPHLDRFGLLLAATSTAIVAMSLLDLRQPLGQLRSEVAWAFGSALMAWMFLLALRASAVARRWRIVADVGVGILLSISFGLLVVDVVSDVDLSGFNTRMGPSPLWLALSVLSPVVVVRRLLKHRRVTSKTLLGAISAYRLIAVALAFAFMTLDAYSAVSFFR